MPMAKLLLLEDDPPTRLFLHETLLVIPAQVQCTSTLAQAEAAIQRIAFDLWLFDANVPDGHSADLLIRLRIAGIQTPAIALTADNDAAMTTALLASGFSQVVIKPVAGAELLQVVGKLLPAAAEHDLWNHRHALAAAGGVENTRAALHDIFLQELPDLQRQIIDALAQGQHPLAGSLLHRLNGSCALVGADALREAVFALSNDLGQPSLRDRFVSACQRTLREKP